MSKRKLDARSFSQQKRKRRQWLNAWLTIAATAVMTITLLVIFTTFVARNVLLETVSGISNNVDMSIYVKTETSDENIKKIKQGLEQLSSVRSVLYISPSDARKDFAESNKTNGGALEALNEATNQFPGTFRIKPVDINETGQLRDFVANDAVLKENIDPNREPSFAGQRRTAIENIGNWIGFAQTAGLIASIIFLAISSLIIFNTIRMAIFNRKDEIQMMKLIGADRNFIRGPFIVEAVVYGFIAAIIATALGVALLYGIRDTLLDAGIVVQTTIDFVTGYLPLVVLAMILLGGIIGTMSSLLATRRYLKI
jgi:cell division transport system permease protein